MSDETKKPAGPGYTVDEILAEYSSKGGQGPRPEPKPERPGNTHI